MLKPSREDMISKLEKVYKTSFSSGTSLISPEKSKKQKRTQDIPNPEDKAVIYWKPRDFIHYFARTYLNDFDISYNISYESDLKTVNQLAKFFKSIGIDYRFHLRGFIEWAFENKQIIIDKTGYITLQTITQFANEYLQQKVLEFKTESEFDAFDFVGEIDSLYQDGKMFSAIKRYGIPIVASYLKFHKNHEESFIINSINCLNVNEDDLSRIAKSSIIRSPYLSEMSLLDWREVFGEKFLEFHNKKWWREVDYSGIPLESYRNIVNE